MRYQDDQIFLVTGGNSESMDVKAAVIIAAGEDRAKQVFEKNHPGFVPLAWPTLQAMRYSAEMMEAAARGKELPGDLALFVDESLSS